MCEVLVETMSFSVLRGGERLPLVVDSGWVQLGHAPHVRALRWSEVTGIWRPDPMSARLDHPSGVPLQFTFETPEERDRFHLAARAARPDLVPQQGHGSAGTSGWMGIQEFVLCGLVLVLLGTIASWLSLGNLVSANLSPAAST